MAQKEKKSRETAETMAEKQRDISVSEFFLKNRHLLGFDSPRKALPTAQRAFPPAAPHPDNSSCSTCHVYRVTSHINGRVDFR